jgi:hypothetical protein
MAESLVCSPELATQAPALPKAAPAPLQPVDLDDSDDSDASSDASENEAEAQLTVLTPEIISGIIKQVCISKVQGI